jgi:hypothetical protein
MNCLCSALLPEAEIERLLADRADVQVDAVLVIYEFWQERRT